MGQTSGAWSAPNLGYLFDSESRSLRAVQGVPGAASLEGGVPFDAKLESAVVDPSRRYAILRLSEGGLTLVRLAGDPAARAIDSSATSVTLSASGDAALFYDPESHQAQVWTALAAQPSLQREFLLDSFQAAAITDDGSLVATAGEAGVRLYDGDRVSTLSASNGIKALTFRRGSRDLAAADSAGDQILLFRGGEPEAATVASVQDGVAEPVALSFSESGGKLIAANAKGRSVLLIDLQTQAKTTLACDCEPSTLGRAQGDAVFQISNAQDRQIFFLDGDAVEPRLFAIFAGGTR